MANVVDALLEIADQDTQLLMGDDARGDNFSIPRDIKLLFCVPNKNNGGLCHRSLTTIAMTKQDAMNTMRNTA